MNKKYLNSGLIVLLVIIWGSVIYKYFGKQTHSQIASEFVSSNHNYKNDYKMVKDTFKLELINSNPFKASNKVKKRVAHGAAKLAQKKNTKKAPNKANIVWPTITYHGFVMGENKSRPLILLKINNRLYRKREKEIQNEVLLIKAYNDSLIVSFNNTKKTIQKKHD